MPDAKSTIPIHYTRCPVPTASGIAFQRGMFNAAFAGSRYHVQDLQSLGPEHRAAVARYLATTLRAARWAGSHPDEARTLVARECAVPPERLDGYPQPGYLGEPRPGFEAQHLRAAQVMQDFLHRRGYLASTFDLEAWSEPSALDEAIALEGKALSDGAEGSSSP